MRQPDREHALTPDLKLDWHDFRIARPDVASQKRVLIESCGAGMDARQVRTAADARELVEARGLSHVKVGATDIDGVIRGKYMAREKFLSALKSGFSFLRRGVRLGLRTTSSTTRRPFTGWHTAFPDATVRD